MFKKRLKELGEFLLSIVLLLAGASLLVGFFKLLDWIYPNLGTAILAIFCLLVIAFIIFGFIYWLFIEPFKKENRKKKAN